MLAFSRSYQHLTSLKLIKVCCENIGLRYWSNICGWYGIPEYTPQNIVIAIHIFFCRSNSIETLHSDICHRPPLAWTYIYMASPVCLTRAVLMCLLSFLHGNPGKYKSLLLKRSLCPLSVRQVLLLRITPELFTDLISQKLKISELHHCFKGSLHWFVIRRGGPTQELQIPLY